MPRLFLAMTLLSALSALAQKPLQPAAGSNWQHVQALPAGTTIYLKAGHINLRCALTSVDADTLTCSHGKPITFQRASINSIKVPRRAMSAALMAGAGAGVGVLTVELVDATVFHGFGGGRVKGTVWAGGAGIGAVVFGSIGYFADPGRSTIYKAQ
jgi:hypothetical protein